MMYEYKQWRLKGSLFLVMMPLVMGAMEQQEEIRIDSMNLIEASTYGRKEIIDKLIEKGADIDAVDKDGCTALMRASERGHKEIVNKLIEKGADIHVVTQDGWTALIRASDEGHKKIVDKLIEKGANIDAATQDGWTALMRASSRGHKEVVDKLIERGANIDDADKGGRTALMRASRNGYKEIVDKLIEKGADPYIKNKEGKNCLDVADNKELKDYIVAKHRVYKKKCIEHLAAFLQKSGEKNGRYWNWSGSDTEKKSGPFEKDIALHIAQIRYGVTEDEWRQMCRLENEEVR